MPEQDFKDKILLDIHKDVGILKENYAEIKVDVKEHIRRTNILEAKVGNMERLFWLGNGIFLAGGLILKYLKVI